MRYISLFLFLSLAAPLSCMGAPSLNERFACVNKLRSTFKSPSLSGYIAHDSSKNLVYLFPSEPTEDFVKGKIFIFSENSMDMVQIGKIPMRSMLAGRQDKHLFRITGKTFGTESKEAALPHLEFYMGMMPRPILYPIPTDKIKEGPDNNGVRKYPKDRYETKEAAPATDPESLKKADAALAELFSSYLKDPAKRKLVSEECGWITGTFENAPPAPRTRAPAPGSEEPGSGEPSGSTGSAY